MSANKFELMPKPVPAKFYYENNTLPSFTEAINSHKHMGIDQPARRVESNQLFDYMPSFVRISTSSANNVYSPRSPNYLYAKSSGYEHTEKFHISVSLNDYLSGKAYTAIKNSVEKNKLDVFFKMRLPPAPQHNLDGLNEIFQSVRKAGVDHNPYEMLPSLIYKGSEDERVVKNLQFTFYWKIGQNQSDFIKTMSKIDTGLKNAGVEPAACDQSDIKVTDFLSFRDENESRYMPNKEKMMRNPVLAEMKKEIAERDSPASTASIA